MAVARELTGFVWQIFQLMAPADDAHHRRDASEDRSRFGGNYRSHPLAAADHLASQP